MPGYAHVNEETGCVRRAAVPGGLDEEARELPFASSCLEFGANQLAFVVGGRVDQVQTDCGLGSQQAAAEKEETQRS